MLPWSRVVTLFVKQVIGGGSVADGATIALALGSRQARQENPQSFSLPRQTRGLRRQW
jgi:hypothetical protein